VLHASARVLVIYIDMDVLTITVIIIYPGHKKYDGNGKHTKNNSLNAIYLNHFNDMQQAAGSPAPAN
jgi:hypothetical protein